MEGGETDSNFPHLRGGRWWTTWAPDRRSEFDLRVGAMGARPRLFVFWFLADSVPRIRCVYNVICSANIMCSMPTTSLTLLPLEVNYTVAILFALLGALFLVAHLQLPHNVTEWNRDVPSLPCTSISARCLWERVFLENLQERRRRLRIRRTVRIRKDAREK